jgi:glycerophosphoryl diester phosphodiesterase
MAPWPYPFWIAHRGAGKLAPENTLAAFRLGAQHGYRAFECDMKLSADGLPFLLHDAKLNGHGLAAALTWSQLAQLDAGAWHSRRYAGEPLPSLDNIAAFCITNGHALNIEIKPTPGDERRTGEVVAREATRLWQGQAVPPLLSSFKVPALEGAMASAPALPRALLIDGRYDGWFEDAQRLGCVAVVSQYALYDRAMLEQLHTAGLRALAYTVNDESVAQWLIGLGLDGLITDAVDRFAPTT